MGLRNSVCILLLFFVFLSAPAFAQRESSPRISSPAGNLRSCIARENVVKTRMAHLIRLSSNMEDKFSSIAARVENYYTTKVVPSGKTVTDYNKLVLDIVSKKAGVGAALTVAQKDVNAFNCSTGNPKNHLRQFRIDMQAVKRALKSYRTSIRNLIVAVRSVTGETERENKGTPKPS